MINLFLLKGEKGMKKSLLILLGFVLSISLILGGCSSLPATTSAPAPAQTSQVPKPPASTAPAPASSTTAAPKPSSSAPATTQAANPATVLKLSWASPGAPMVPYEAYYQQWADQLKAETGGRLEIKLYYSESLVKMADSFTAVENGVADIAGFGISIDPSRVPLNMVSMLPLLGTNGDIAVATRVQTELIKKYPALANEFKTVKLLTIYSATPRSLSMAKKKVLVPEDIRGSKIIVTGVGAQIFAGLGAATLPLAPPDWATSLNTGLAEGAASPLDALDVFKALDAVTYHLNLPGDDMGWGTTCIIMNKDSWNKIPPDIQKLIDEKYAPMLQQKLVEIQKGLAQASIDKATKAGHTFATCSPDQYKLWVDAMTAQIEKVWIAPNEAKGLPARAIYNDFRALAKQYSTK
jgi:TRAP-type C4-dicarboxylate transport system substrate-binding protein